MAIKKESTSSGPLFLKPTTAHIRDVTTDGLITTPSVGRKLLLDSPTKLLPSSLSSSSRLTLKMILSLSGIQILPNTGFRSLKSSAKKSTLKSLKTTKSAKNYLLQPPISNLTPRLLLSLPKIFQCLLLPQLTQIFKNLLKASNQSTISKPFKLQTLDPKLILISDSVQAPSNWLLVIESQLQNKKLFWMDSVPRIHFSLKI